MAHAHFVIVEDNMHARFDGEPLGTLVIRDSHSHHSTCRSVTNDAEYVVKKLVADGKLPEGRKLLYYDSMGVLDEIVHEDGKFVGFRPGPRKEYLP